MKRNREEISSPRNGEGDESSCVVVSSSEPIHAEVFEADLRDYRTAIPMSKPEPLAMFTWEKPRDGGDTKVVSISGGEHIGTCKDGRLRPPVLLEHDEIRKAFGKVLPEVCKEDDDSTLFPVFDVIVNGLNPTVTVNAARKADVITWRNNLTKIMLCAFDGRSRQNDWDIDVEAVGHTIYLGIVPDDTSIGPDAALKDDWPSKCARWGRGFETVVSRSADVDGKYECASPCYVLVGTSVGRHHILMGAEVDAFDRVLAAKIGDDGCSPLRNTAPLIELKTHGMSSVLPDDKLLSLWIQSYLAGVPTIVIGHRDDRGALRRLSRLNVLDIPSLYNKQQQKHPHWHPKQGFAFLDQFITWLSEQIAKTESDPVHPDVKRLHVSCRHNVDGGRLRCVISASSVASGSPLKVLSQAYIDIVHKEHH